MTDLVHSVLNQIRGIPKKDEQRSLLEDLLAQRAGQSRKEQIHESQMKIVNDRYFAEVRKKFEEARKAEEERMSKINEARMANLEKAREKRDQINEQREKINAMRLKNLAKARRKLKKNRSKQ